MLAGWVKSVIVFSIFSSLVMYMLPGDKYKKYMQIVVGLVMIIVVMNPIIELLDLKQTLRFDYFYESLGQEVYENEDKYAKSVMETMICEYVYKEYGQIVRAEITIDENYNIEKLQMFHNTENYQETMGQALYENGEIIQREPVVKKEKYSREEVVNGVSQAFLLPAKAVSFDY